MAKTKISEFSSTPSNNTDIDSINIAEGCAPSGINDAIRELMAQLKDWQSGTSNDPYVVGSSGSLTLNQGTANGIPYLNGSKVVTSGSALTFDGSTLATTGALTVDGNTTLGNASSDTVTVNGYMGVGGAASASRGIYVTSSALTGSNQAGIWSAVVGSSGGTNSISALYALPSTADAVFTASSVRGLTIGTGTRGASSTATDWNGIYIADQTQGTNNYGITSVVSSGSNKWNIYASGTAQNYFSGNVLVGDTTSTTSPLSAGSFITASSTTGSELILKNSSGIVTGELVGGVAFGNDDPTSGTPPHYSGIQARSIDSSGTMTLGFYTGLANYEANTPQVLIDASGNVGVGTSSPLALLNTYQVNGGGDANILFQNFSTTTSTAVALYLSPTNGSLTTGSIRSAFIKGINVGGGVTALTFGTNASGADPTEKMRIDSAGNLGLGVTPSASWWTSTKSIGIGRLGNGVFGATNDDEINIGANVINTGSGTYIYGATDTASLYRQVAAQHVWYYAGSGTAGAALTLSEAMRINASGNVGIGTSSPACTLDVTGGIQTSRTAVTSPASTDGNVFSGTYTPTLFNTTNVAASTAYECQYMRVGNTVTVSGQVDIDPTSSATDTILGMSLPIASALTATRQLGGTGAIVTPSRYGEGAGINADLTNDRAQFLLRPSSANSSSYAFSFTYRVI